MNARGIDPGTETGTGIEGRRTAAGGAAHETDAADLRSAAEGAGHARGHAGQGRDPGIAGGGGHGRGIVDSGRPEVVGMAGEAIHVPHSGLYSSEFNVLNTNNESL